MISFNDISKLFSYDLEGKFCIEIEFLVKGEPIYQSCWMGKMPDREKKEKEILELCRAGKKCSAIADEMGYSERTIQRRRKELDSRIKDVIRI